MATGKDRMFDLGFFWWPDRTPEGLPLAFPSINDKAPQSAITCAPVVGAPHFYKWSDTCSLDCCQKGGQDMQFYKSYPSSMHGGGVNVVFASGRGLFLRENIENKVMIALMTLDDENSDTPHKELLLEDSMYQ
jgi:hypothetical protein